MNIPIPKYTKDLRIKHFKALSNPIYSDELTIRELCEFMAEFTGEHYNDVLTWDIPEMTKAFHHVKEIFADIRINKPPQVIWLGGQEYELVNPHKVGAGWHMDFEKGDIEKDPVWIACLFYYPKGVKYGTTDENKNLLYPIADRYNTIEREMELQTFLEASAFFLSKIERSMRDSMERRKATEKIVKALQSLRGKKQLTSSQMSSLTEIGNK